MREIVDEVIAAYHGVPGVMERFKYTRPMAVYNWRSRGLPKYLLVEIHLDTKIELERLQTGVSQKQTPN